MLVLGEATNAIDATGEAESLAHLAALDPRPTIVMISHCAESMARCDRVITVERGRPSVRVDPPRQGILSCVFIGRRGHDGTR